MNTPDDGKGMYARDDEERLNTPDDNRLPSQRQAAESNIGLWVLAAIGAFLLFGAISWTTSETIDNAQSTTQPQVQKNIDSPATTGDSTGETGKGP